VQSEDATPFFFPTLLQFCFDGQTVNRAGLKLATQRLIAIVHAINPDALSDKGKPLSLRELSELPFVSATPAQLRRMSLAWLKQWGFKVHVKPVKRKRIRS